MKIADNERIIRLQMPQIKYSFFEKPILNSPYKLPKLHWELDESGQPTERIVHERRHAKFITPIPKPKKNQKTENSLFADSRQSSEEGEQQYDLMAIINGIRIEVNQWRSLPKSKWLVTPETAILLEYWRHHEFSSIRPFFCQLEAVETAIWLIEVAPHSVNGKKTIAEIVKANKEANPNLLRMAFKLATGAGKTTVMAMIMAWQTINAVRYPNSKKFSKGFLIVAPGITIKDRLRVLQPNDSDSYFRKRELIPMEMMADVNHAKIVITNYHAFKLRERLDISKGGRQLLQGRSGESISTLETEGQMLQRVVPELMGMKNIVVINDEAHHCYREKPGLEDDDEKLSGEEKKEAEENNEAARLWITGLEILQRKIGIHHVFDLSATPFFLRGSGYREGTLFHWTVSDFSLMDAIECGIVKLPRVPIADNIPGEQMPMFRNLWDNISKLMPKKGRGKSDSLSPDDLPAPLQTALQALYGHYEKTFILWEQQNIEVPPCFIVVCNNTATSKLVFDWITGFHRNADDKTGFQSGYLSLFRNFDESGQPLAKPRTLLIDSEQLESGEALDEKFRETLAPEIEQFRREIVERTGNAQEGKNISDQDLLREVMNTVGKVGRLGETIRCVVSVSMLTEGWDTNTVTHVLGVRAFGTQLLCEQVVGRALRRQSYELNEEGLFNVEYADVLGIPFDFNAKPTVAPPQPPKKTIHVFAVPERKDLEIAFPRIKGYRFEVSAQPIKATFTKDSRLILTPEMVGASNTKNSGIIGESVDLTLDHTANTRTNQIVYLLTNHLMTSTRWRDADGSVSLQRFGQFKAIVQTWLADYFICQGGTYPAQLIYKTLANMAADRINLAIDHYVKDHPTDGESKVHAILQPYNPKGSSDHVNFHSSKDTHWKTDSRKCHINFVIADSSWESEFCRVVESEPLVASYVKNHALGFEVPYLMGAETKAYCPDFIVNINDGHPSGEPLHLIVETKGYRGEDAKIKKETLENRWLPAVNRLGIYGRWDFIEFCEVHDIARQFSEKLKIFIQAIERE